jgi:hypothetical protein
LRFAAKWYDDRVNIVPITASPIATNPIATSTTIAQTYGFAPAFALPASAPVTFQAISEHPDIVNGVTPIGGILRAREFPSFIIDEYA